MTEKPVSVLVVESPNGQNGKLVQVNIRRRNIGGTVDLFGSFSDHVTEAPNYDILILHNLTAGDYHNVLALARTGKKIILIPTILMDDDNEYPQVASAINDMRNLPNVKIIEKDASNYIQSILDAFHLLRKRE